jgi:biopolymer transport protein ExbD
MKTRGADIMVCFAMLLFAAGCTTAQELPPFVVHVHGDGATCSIEAEGRQLTSTELFALAKTRAKTTQQAHIDGNVGGMPFRCFGGVLFDLQRAGFAKVGFISEPPGP